MQQPSTLITNWNSGKPIHWPSVLQLGLSLLGALTLWGFALIIVAVVLGSTFNLPGNRDPGDSMPLLLLAAGVAFGGILLLPSAGYAYLRILGKPRSAHPKLRSLGWLIILIPPLVGSGYLVARIPIFSLIVLPPIHVLTIGISILWLVSLGVRGLSAGSAQRDWGIFGTGMVMAPLLSLLAEIILMLGVGIVGISYLARDPVFAAKLAQFSESYLADPSQPPDAFLELIKPYLMQPITVYGALLIGAVLVPLIEEFFKPVGMWLLAGQQLTPDQGFTAGVLSGAGFALFENFSLTASSGEEWSLVVLARLGTSMIHILTAGLTGWALALAWTEKRYIRLGVTFLVSVTIHALWNGLVILAIVPELLPGVTAYPDILRNIGSVSPIGFIGLLIGGFALLVGCNKTLRRAIMSPEKAQPILETSEPSLAVETIEENQTNGNHQLSD